MNIQNMQSRHALTVLVSLLLTAVMLMSALAGCANTPDETPTETADPTDTFRADVDMDLISQKIDSMQASDYVKTKERTEYVKISVKDYGDIVVRLLFDVAPYAVTNFQDLVEEGFYTNNTFHRVMKGFVIQAGSPNGDGTGSTGNEIMGEFSENGINNELSHIRGVLSMARRGNDYNSASSQFFIVHEDSTEALDGKYAAFGYVVAGMDVVDAIANVNVTTSITGEKSQPISKIVIESACFVKRDKTPVENVTTTAPVEEEEATTVAETVEETTTAAEETTTAVEETTTAWIEEESTTVA